MNQTFLVILCLFLLHTYTVSAQFYTAFNLISSPTLNNAPVISPPERKNFAHPAVVRNAAAEAQLPPEMLNPFYKNPAIANALARESWFGNKEMPVFQREAEKIPRSEIYKIFQRAGFNNRR